MPAGFPLLAEGRYHTPEVAVAALRLGATGVVVGTAITDPAFLTARFATIVSGQGRVAPGQLG